MLSSLLCLHQTDWYCELVTLHHNGPRSGCHNATMEPKLSRPHTLDHMLPQGGGGWKISSSGQSVFECHFMKCNLFDLAKSKLASITISVDVRQALTKFEMILYNTKHKTIHIKNKRIISLVLSSFWSHLGQVPLLVSYQEGPGCHVLVKV